MPVPPVSPTAKALTRLAHSLLLHQKYGHHEIVAALMRASHVLTANLVREQIL